MSLAEAVRRQRADEFFSGLIYCHQERLGIGALVEELELVAKASEPSWAWPSSGGGVLGRPHTAARLWVDAILDPAETREVLARTLELVAQNLVVAEFKTGVLQT